MSSLQQRLKRPEPYLIALLLVVSLGLLDTLRSPDNQIIASLYVHGVEDFYQPVFRPLEEGREECRYIPTCSEYSVIAVKRFGFWRGLSLSIHRIRSCTLDVPMGTHDPVPKRRSDP